MAVSREITCQLFKSSEVIAMKAQDVKARCKLCPQRLPSFELTMVYGPCSCSTDSILLGVVPFLKVIYRVCTSCERDV